MNSHVEALFAEDLHRVPHGDVGNSVFVRKRSFGRKLPSDLAGPDPADNVVSHLDVGMLTPEGIHRSSWHMINIDMS